MSTELNQTSEPRPKAQGTEPPVVSTSVTKRADEPYLSCIAVGCGATGIILLFLGIVGWLGYRYIRQMPGDTHYHVSQIPIGGQIPDWVKDDMLNGQPVELGNVEGLAEFLDQLASRQLGASDVIDYSRAVLEMQATGLSRDVNRISRKSWERRIKNAISLPDLGEQYKVIDLHWTIPEKELRLSVLVRYYSSMAVYYLYLCKHDKSWRMYDLRDPLSPASEVQYLGLFAQSSPEFQENVWRLNERLREINEIEDIDSEEKAKLAITAFREKQYFAQMRWMAIDNTLSWLYFYQNPDAMLEMLLEPDNGDFVGLNIYRAQMLLFRKNRKAEAFKAAMSVNGRMSWHPEATRLAFLAAETPDEIAQLESSFNRLVLLLPDSAQQLFQEAELDQLQLWCQRLSQSEEGVKRLLSLLGKISDSKKLIAMRTALGNSKNPQQELLYNFLTIRSAQSSEELDLVPAARSLMRSPVRSLLELPEPHSPESSSQLERIQWQIVSRMSQRDDLIKLLEIDSDHQLLVKFRDRSASGYAVKNWEQALQVIQSGDEQFLAEPATSVALGSILEGLGQSEETWDRLITVWDNIRDKVMTEEVPDFVTNIVTKLSKLAIDKDRVAEYCNTIDIPELVFLSLYSAMSVSGNWQKWKQVSDWYLQKSGKPDAWHYYVESQYHYAQHNWQAAEALMPKAVELAEEDSRNDERDFPSILQPWIPYEDSPSEWSLEHAGMALRSGNLLNWMESRRQSPERLLHEIKGVLWRIRWVPDEALHAGVLKKLEEICGSLDGCKPWIHALRSSKAAQRGEFELAVQERVEELRHIEGATYQIFSLLRMANYHRVDWSKWQSQLEELTKENPVVQAFIRQAAAIRSGKLRKFHDLVKSDLESSVIREWKYWYGCSVLKTAHAWQEFNRLTPMTMYDLESIRVDTGVIVLNQSATELLDELSEVILKRYGLGVKTVPLSRFPAASGAWIITISQREFLLVAYDRSSLDGQVSGLESISDYPGYLAVAQLTSPLMQKIEIEKRKFVADFGSLWAEHAVGYFDSLSDSRFVGNNWHELLRENAGTGFNPHDFVYYSLYPYQDMDKRDSESVFIRAGLILERLEVTPVEIEEGVGRAEKDGKVVALQTAPLTCPVLSVGDRLRLE